jgi:hypothetical protein
MARKLEHEGVFKATPTAWGLQDSQNTQSVALVVTFKILEQFADGGWQDWREYEDHEITGWFYIVKKDGGVNTATVENLVKSIGWDGNLDLSAGPQDITCQITTANEEYNGKTTLKVQWLNPGDYTPGIKTVDPAKASDLQRRYGSQMRAAAAAAKPKHTATTKATPPPPRPAPAPTPEVAEDDLPFEDRPAVVSGEPAVGLGAGDTELVTSGSGAVREQPTPAPQLAMNQINQARIDRQIDQHVELTMLESMGFVELPTLEHMSIDQLRAHANAIRDHIDTGSRRLIQAAFADGDRDKALRALKAIHARKAA